MSDAREASTANVRPAVNTLRVIGLALVVLSACQVLIPSTPTPQPTTPVVEPAPGSVPPPTSTAPSGPTVAPATPSPVRREEEFAAQGPFEFATGETPSLRSFTPTERLSQEYGVTIFRYPDALAFAKAQAEGFERPEPTDLLARAGSFRAVPRPSRLFGAKLDFPVPLSAGFYLAELRALPNGTTEQVRFQVTDISYFVSATATKTLLWFNDLSTKGPLQNAQLETEAERLTVGPDGVIVLPTPKGGGRSVYRVSAPGKQAVLVLSEVALNEADYWRYLHLDRGVYRPDDTVRFWGVLRPREVAVPPIDRVRVALRRADGRHSLVDVTVPVRDATFAGEIRLPGLDPGSYALALTVEGVQVWSSGLQIENYAKPAYTLEVSATPRAAVSGDSVEFRASVVRSDGAPAANVPITFTVPKAATLYGGFPTDRVEATTDARGIATLSRPVSAEGGGSNFQWFPVEARARTTSGELVSSVWLPLFPGRAHVSATSRVEDGRGEVRLVLRELSLDRLNRGETGKLPDLYLGRPLAGWPVVLTDPFSRTDVTLQTDASGEARYSFPVEVDKSHVVQVTAVDEAQRRTTRQLEVLGPAYRRHGERTLGPGGWRRWKVGETVELTYFLEGGKIPQPRPQAFLFYTTRLGLDRYRVRSDAVFRFAFREEDVPGTHARGIYFDGRAYHMTWEHVCGSIDRPTTLVRADLSDRELSVTVRPERPEYQPGETVRLDVEVRDRAGRPVRANVNLSVVDGASPPLEEAEVDERAIPGYPSRAASRLIPGLYWPVSAGPIDRSSHSEPTWRVGGCEGPFPIGPTLPKSSVTAHFRSLTTDAVGRASVSFTLPADVRSWRITYHALTERMESASGTIDLRVRDTR